MRRRQFFITSLVLITEKSILLLTKDTISKCLMIISVHIQKSTGLVELSMPFFELQHCLLKETQVTVNTLLSHCAVIESENMQYT